ncbi:MULTISPECIES: hypothetical protein [unclassified Pseudomonas]|uniref:hypothetical protein n=1 Tax=unclassified Pseudomonas TaxID=196821 RepID=UPI0009DA34AA|nr:MULTISPECIES: hypothetical protein [unclassified Pseudomonas]MBD9517859.1 hypothetical protein [Pseudomonas sp. PDM22]MBD9631781.1 hypothetical protein [Pseudomonas sp. PDM19]OQR34266.1 hypothetical protein BWR15_09730 [Pseudomonas sp. T]
MTEFLPVPLESRPYEDVMFINALASIEQLRDAALRRLTAVEDLLSLLEDDSDPGLIRATSRLASALLPLVSEARQLYELSLDRPTQERVRGRNVLQEVDTAIR